MPRLFAVFDLETNGFHGASVLSASSIVFTDEGRIVDFFNRFYYPEERPDRRTEAVHGLSPERIGALRTEEKYPAHFLDDWTSLALFWEQWSPEGIAVHNLPFDTGFLPGTVVRRQRWWCSMRGLTDLCCLPGGNPAGGRWKLPRLREAVRTAEALYPSSPTLAWTEGIVGPHLSHYGLSDCFELYGLVLRVLGGSPTLVRFAPSAAPSRFRPPMRGRYPIPHPHRDIFVRERFRYAARVADAAAMPERKDVLERLAAGEEPFPF